MLELAREKGLREVKANIYAFKMEPVDAEVLYIDLSASVVVRSRIIIKMQPVQM